MCIDGRFQWTELQNKEYWDKQRDSQRDKKMCHDFFEPGTKIVWHSTSRCIKIHLDSEV